MKLLPQFILAVIILLVVIFVILPWMLQSGIDPLISAGVMLFVLLVGMMKQE